MTIFFYILKDYFKYVIGTVLLTVFLFILFDFIHKTTSEFAEKAPSGQNIIKFYAFQIPEQVVQALPIASLLASVIAMVLLSRTNEITAMRAAGMGPFQIGLPLAAGGLALSVFSMILNEAFVPRYAQQAHFIHEVLIRGEKDEQISGGAKWMRSGQNLYNFQEFDPISQTLSKVKIVQVRPNFRPVQATEAETAVFAPNIGKWYLKGIKVLHFKRNGVLDYVDFHDTEEVVLPIEPQKLKKDRRKPGELSIKELNELVDRGDQSGVDTLPYKVDLHVKLAYPFAAFVVSLIGLKFGYKSERTTETAKGVLIAFFIGISYWFVMSAGRALGLRGDIHPFLAAWMANVVILVIIGFDAWMSRRA